VTSYEIPDGPKMLRETLCVAAAMISDSPWGEDRKLEHLDRLQRLINACDRHRLLGPDGKHGNRHTPTCGCEDAWPNGVRCPVVDDWCPGNADGVLCTQPCNPREDS
jgi:hypothetical protein